MWIADEPLGDLDDWGCWLGPPIDSLVERARAPRTFWQPDLEGLSATEQFDRLDRVWYEAHRGECLTGLGGTEEAALEAIRNGHGNPTMLLHSSEAFDGWKAFCIDLPDGETDRWLWTDVANRPRGHDVSRRAFLEVAEALDFWRVEREREWRGD